MAFMMPVMKNNYDIYKDPRSRKTSDCSNGSSNSSSVTTTSTPTAGGRGSGSGRIRKVSECKSESFAASPSHVPSYRMQMQRCQSSRAFTRNSSRTSSNALSPTRSFSQAGMMTSGGNSAGGGGGGVGGSGSGSGGSPKKRNGNDSNANGNGSQNDLSKFHLRLVEKLRKSFRKDSAKRS